mmetsp:Transcript_72094/g.168722  ORF Transcript_72094/g.168722 Transcript_72094/m.168722 type:complete len:110 (-) Transcript_72094:1037-1366(-)
MLRSPIYTCTGRTAHGGFSTVTPVFPPRSTRQQETTLCHLKGVGSPLRQVEKMPCRCWFLRTLVLPKCMILWSMLDPGSQVKFLKMMPLQKNPCMFNGTDNQVRYGRTM